MFVLIIEIKVNGSLIPWAGSFLFIYFFIYLGIVLKSATRFSVEMKPAKAKFYRSFNSLYCKIYKANENLISSLVHIFCVPIIVFSLEALNFVLNTVPHPYMVLTPLSITFLQKNLNVMIDIF